MGSHHSKEKKQITKGDKPQEKGAVEYKSTQEATEIRGTEAKANEDKATCEEKRQEKVIKENTAKEERKVEEAIEEVKQEGLLSHSVTSVIFSYLYARDLCHIARTCKEFNRTINKADIVWHALCDRRKFVVNHKLPHHSWKDVCKQMILFQAEMRREKAAYKKRYDEWRKTPNMPVLPHSTSPHQLPGGFKMHPEESAKLVFPSLSLLPLVAKMYLDLLIAASTYKENFENEEFLSQALIRYEKFLHLKHKYPNVTLIPTLEIEYVWVSHMLRPNMYINDCMALFGQVIDHDIMLKSEYQCLNKASSLAETRRLYDLEFNSGDTSNHYCSNELIGDNHPRKTNAEIGPISGERVFDSKTIRLTISDIRMDNLWLAEYNEFMKKSLHDPLQSSLILTDVGDGYTSNPSGLATRALYNCTTKSYEKFLFMAAKYPPSEGTYVHPTFAIDVIWHSHMISPKTGERYARETKEWVGYIVDHEPWPGCDKEVMKKGCAGTEDLWKQEFNTDLHI